MGRSRDGESPRGDGAAGGLRSVASFPSPSSSSSSDFEFTVSLSPTSKRSPANLCPADELFYKGQLLPLHLSPRISMVRTLLLASASTSSSSDTTTTTSRDSNGSSSSSFSADLSLLPDCDSSRPSSVTEEEARRIAAAGPGYHHKRAKYFAAFANRFSAFFLHRGSKKEVAHHLSTQNIPPPPPPSSAAKGANHSLAKEVIKKYVKKVKPLYEKLSSLQQKQNHHHHHHHYPHDHRQEQQQQQQQKTFSFSIRREKLKKAYYDNDHVAAGHRDQYSNSFSGNLRHPQRKRWAASCPSSMRSSPSHSGLLSASGGGAGAFPDPLIPSSSTVSSMEELQNAIQGAIAHCKSSMIQANQKKPASAPVGLSDDICGS